MEDGKKVALVLGGTVPHKELIRQLQNRNYYTILIDYLCDSPARSQSDEHIQESTLDSYAVLRIAKMRKADLVISSAIDQANITCCYVAEKLGLPHPYSYETSLNVTHKDRMKRIMVEGGVTTAPFLGAGDIDQFDKSGIGFPCIVKPTNSNGSKGVRIANNGYELRMYLALARKASRTGDALVERFIEGVEVSSYYYVQDGVAYPLATCQKSKYTQFAANGVRQYESVLYPAELSARALKCLDQAANAIAQAFGLMNTPLFIQAIVNADGEAHVLEFAPRLGGGLCFRSIPMLADFDYISASIDSFLGNSVDVSSIKRCDKMLLIGNMFAKPGFFDHVRGVERAIEIGVIEEFHTIKTRGAEVCSDGSSGSRFGQFIIMGDSRDELVAKDAKARKLIRAIDTGGRDFSA